MHHKLSVLVQVDLDGRHVRLVVTGCLREVNHRALCPVLRRARTLLPGIAVIVDVSSAHHVEAAALDLLHWAAEHEDAVRGTPPVEFVVPAELPAHGTIAPLTAGPAGRPATRPVRGSVSAQARRRPAPGSRLAS